MCVCVCVCVCVAYLMMMTRSTPTSDFEKRPEENCSEMEKDEEMKLQINSALIFPLSRG